MKETSRSRISILQNRPERLHSKLPPSPHRDNFETSTPPNPPSSHISNIMAQYGVKHPPPPPQCAPPAENAAARTHTHMHACTPNLLHHDSAVRLKSGCKLTRLAPTQKQPHAPHLSLSAHVIGWAVLISAHTGKGVNYVIEFTARLGGNLLPFDRNLRWGLRSACTRICSLN